MKPIRTFILAWLIELCWCGVAIHAQEGSDTDEPTPPPEERIDEGSAVSKPVGTLSLHAGAAYYLQKDSGGNPWLDEDEGVIEPVLILKHEVSRKWSYTVKGQADFITSASIEDTLDFPGSQQSGATGDDYYGVDASATRIWDDWKFEFGGGYSDEYDLDSIKARAGLIREVNRDLTTVSLGLDYYRDLIDDIRFTGEEFSGKTRNTFGVNLGWTQIVNPSLLTSVGIGLTEQRGYLQTNFYFVVLNGTTRVSERLPDSRSRRNVYGRALYSLTKNSSVEVDAKFYNDDWDINAVSAEVAYSKYFLEKKILGRLKYRIYRQSESKYFADDFDGSERYLTSDADLAAFTTQTLGIKLIVQGIYRNADLTVGLDFIPRSDDVDMIIGMVGYDFRF